MPAAVAVAIGGTSAKGRPTEVALVVAGQVVTRLPPDSPAATVARALPATTTIRARGVTTTYAIDRRAASATVARSNAARVSLPAKPIEVAISAPVVAQRLRNNCETAALEVLLATAGNRLDQLTLQRELPRSGPLDPEESAAGPVWGDPDAGYVGRSDGAGAWGGFGVYPGPIARLAARQGTRLRDLTGSAPEQVYASLRHGRAVLAWVGLDDGPYRDWIAPDGRTIRANLNEHTIVLTGLRRDGSIPVVNVLEGTREVWSRDRFEQAWELLGRRALAAP